MIAAARLPLRNDPAKSQFLRPIPHGRIWFSAQLVSMGTAPSSIHHEPDNTHCQCGCALKRIGEDVSEKLDYTAGVFTVERHVRGKWICDDCEPLIQAPVPAQVIDKGIPTAGLLAHVMIAKFAARSRSSV